MMLKITFLPLWPPNDLWPNDYYVAYIGLDWWFMWQDSVKIGLSTAELHYQNKNGIKMVIITLHRIEVLINRYQQHVKIY